MDTIAVAGYGKLLHEGVRDEVCTLAEKIRGNMQRTVESMAASGDMLLRAKDLVPHGQFGPWCMAEFPSLSQRTLQQFMNVAKHVKSEGASFLLLGAEPAKVLSSPKVQPAARQEAVKAHRNGVKVTVQKAKEIVAKHAPEPPSESDHQRRQRLQREAYLRSQGKLPPLSAADVAESGDAGVVSPGYSGWPRTLLENRLQQLLDAIDDGDAESIMEARRTFA